MKTYNKNKIFDFYEKNLIINFWFIYGTHAIGKYLSNYMYVIYTYTYVLSNLRNEKQISKE